MNSVSFKSPAAHADWGCGNDNEADDDNTDAAHITFAHVRAAVRCHFQLLATTAKRHSTKLMSNKYRAMVLRERRWTDYL